MESFWQPTGHNQTNSSNYKNKEMTNILEVLAKAKAELAIAEEENRKDPVSIQKRKMVLYWHNNVERLQSLLS